MGHRQRETHCIIIIWEITNITKPSNQSETFYNITTQINNFLALASEGSSEQGSQTTTKLPTASPWMEISSTLNATALKECFKHTSTHWKISICTAQLGSLRCLQQWMIWLSITNALKTTRNTRSFWFWPMASSTTCRRQLTKSWEDPHSLYP